MADRVVVNMAEIEAQYDADAPVPIINNFMPVEYNGEVERVDNNEFNNLMEIIAKIMLFFLIGFTVPYWILPETKGMIDKETDKMMKPFISVCCGLLVVGLCYDKYIYRE